MKTNQAKNANIEATARPKGVDLLVMSDALIGTLE